MKIIKPLFSQRGEIATVLTFLSLGLMITGILTGAVINQTGTRTLSKAAGCASGEWECTRDGVTHCADKNSRDIFTGTWCNPELRWKWEDAGNTDKCGGSPVKLKPADGNCADVTPTSVPSGNCPSGQWTCKVGTYTRCSDDTAKSEFTANWCEPEQRWQYETAKLLGGNGSECNGKVSQPQPDCSNTTPTPVASGTCPTFQWNCTFDGNTYCTDDAAKTLFLNTWCDGKDRWLWEKAGNTDKCGGKPDIVLNSPNCKRNPSANTSPTPGSSPSPIPTPQPNPTKASNPGGFHLTSDIYAEKATDGIKFNVHILFNSDGCDGDVALFRDGGRVAGYNGWKGPGAFDYNEQWAGSFVVKKGESISPGYEGTVDRCPKSTTTLRDNLSCTLAVDGSGNPAVTGAGCTFKNQSDFPSYNPASPTLGAPSGPDGKYKCQDLTNATNKDCSDMMAGPCEYGTYKYKCMSTACPSDKSVGVGIPFWCDGDKWYDVNKLGECSGACTPAGSPTPTPSSECTGKVDGFVISSC
ncbi:hypothetical protein HZB96_04430, partial [Candidatus Gottesmanbacteria bacterium]|nr:hypothetical protein [Candidatus Gottesmanbacteria bacterium]